MSTKLSTAVADNESCTISPPQLFLIFYCYSVPPPSSLPLSHLHSLQRCQGMPTELLQEWMALKHGLYLEASVSVQPDCSSTKLIVSKYGMEAYWISGSFYYTFLSISHVVSWDPWRRTTWSDCSLAVWSWCSTCRHLGWIYVVMTCGTRRDCLFVGLPVAFWIHLCVLAHTVRRVWCTDCLRCLIFRWMQK